MDRYQTVLERRLLKYILSPYNVVEKRCKKEAMFVREWVYRASLHRMDRKVYEKCQ